MRADDRRAHLEAFLRPHGLDVDALAAEVEPAFGEIRLAVATGSVLQGFGNPRSDIDIYVVVDGDVRNLPVVSFASGARIDVVYHSASALAAQRDLASAPWPAAGPLPQPAWVAKKRAIDAVTRFALSTPLVGDSTWLRWRDELEEDDGLASTVHRWWTVEALRRWWAAQVLEGSSARLATQRWCDACLAALERRAAASGQLYFTSKWLPEKLAATGDDAGLALCRSVLATRAPGYATWARALLKEELDGDVGWRERLACALTALDGVDVARVGHRTLTSRWQARFVEGPDTVPLVGAREEMWRGAWADPVPEPVAELFRADMLWASMVAA